MSIHRYPTLLIQKLNELHAVYSLDLFTDEPLVERPSPEVVSLLRNFYQENSEVICGK